MADKKPKYMENSPEDDMKTLESLRIGRTAASKAADEVSAVKDNYMARRMEGELRSTSEERGERERRMGASLNAKRKK